MTKENPRILIVDDNKDIHMIFRSILQNGAQRSIAANKLESLKRSLFQPPEEVAGSASSLSVQYDVDFAFQGEEAYNMVKLAQATGKPYAMIFMDIRMPPGWDGLETTERIWEIEPTVEVVICTAYSDYSWKDIVGRLGSEDHLHFLSKPFGMAQVRQMAMALTTKWKAVHQ